MATTCLDTNLLTSDGTSQSQRSLDILADDCPMVDERQMADLILFAKKYGAYLNFFDTSNNITDTWQGLMSGDSAVIIAGVSVWQTQEYAAFVKTISDNAINATTAADAKNNFKVLFDFAFSLAMELDTAYNQLDPTSDYAQFLALTINSGLSTPLNAILFYYNKFVTNSLIDITSTFTYNPTPVDTLAFSQNFNIPFTTPLTAPFNLDPAFTTVDIPLSGSVNQEITHILTHNLFSGIYQSFIDGITNIVSRTPAYLAELLTDCPSHTPHYALYLTFLNLFNYAQQHLNGYTKKHLDFYYKQVLELSNSPAQPDFVQLVFTLQKNIAQHLIPAGTQFAAGKDANNNNLFYATLNDVVLQTAAVQDLRSIFLNKGMTPATLFQAPIANSEDGQGAKLLSADGSWFPFGDPQQNTTLASLGFALASNVLYLNEGTRKVTFTFNCNSTNGVTADDLTGVFSIQFTGAKGWYTALSYSAAIVDGDTFSLTTTLEGDAPAIIPFSSKIHSGNFTVALPMAQVMLSGYASYQTIKLMQISSINISVNVDAVKNLALQNDDGKIDTSKPFKIWGDFPDEGTSFIIGSKEIFQKTLDELTINFEWQQEPLTTTTVGISTLVKGDWAPINSSEVSIYASSITIDPTLASMGSSAFMIKNAKLDFKPEIDITPKFELAEPEEFITTGPYHIIDPGYSVGPYIPGYFDFSLPVVDTTGLEIIVQSQPDFTANAAFAVTSVDGYIELNLNNTDYNLATFLGKIPQPSVTVNYDSSVPPNITGYTVSKATPPVATPPALKLVTISYTAEDNIVFTNSAAAFNARTNFFYHIEPFGYREIHPFITTDTPLTFLPGFNLDDGSTNDNGGELWIGLANALADETFSVLFQVSDGSANPLKNMTEVDWYYMSANNWKQFNAQSVTDQTNNLTTSGLVIFNVPGDATTTNTRADNGLIWLKAVVEHDTDAVCNLIAVDANATEAQFVQNIPAGIVFTNTLAPNTISKPAVADAALKQTQQPYSSFGGRVVETDDQFYIRVSERLRHKHRAITAWDYERLTLQYFPQIFKAKCLTHTGFVLDTITNTQKYAETLAGQVTVITIPDLTQLNTVNILRPYTSIGLLTEIQMYLATLTSPFVTVNVCNPQFEEVQFVFSVTFKENYDPTFYSNQLNDAIEQFLTPWAFGNPQDINFGTTIEKSVVLNFVEEQYYVDFVTCFIMNQIVRDGTTVLETFPDIEEAVPTTARSILVSYYDAATDTKHIISTPANCDC